MFASSVSDVTLFRYHYYNLYLTQASQTGRSANLSGAGCLVKVTHYSNGNEIKLHRLLGYSLYLLFKGLLIKVIRILIILLYHFNENSMYDISSAAKFKYTYRAIPLLIAWINRPLTTRRNKFCKCINRFYTGYFSLN